MNKKGPIKNADDAKAAVDTLTDGMTDILGIPGSPLKLEDGALLDEAIDDIQRHNDANKEALEEACK